MQNARYPPKTARHVKLADRQGDGLHKMVFNNWLLSRKIWLYEKFQRELNAIFFEKLVFETNLSIYSQQTVKKSQ